MSRVGKKIMAIPEGVDVSVDGAVIRVKGPLGELTQEQHEFVTLVFDKEENTVQVKVKDESNKFQKSLWGLFARLIENMMTGVSKGYEKILEINGVGLRVALSGNTLNLTLGFSHPVNFELPEGIKAVVEGNKITISGFDKQKVGQVAANIRALKKPEPYKGKGIKYIDEVIRRKAGKTGAA